MFDTVLSFFSAVFEDLKQWVTSGFDLIVDSLIDLKNSIIDAIIKIIDWLYNSAGEYAKLMFNELWFELETYLPDITPQWEYINSALQKINVFFPVTETVQMFKSLLIFWFVFSVALFTYKVTVKFILGKRG